MFFVKGCRLKKIGGIKMPEHFYLTAQLLATFSFKAVDRAFTPDQAPARKFGHLHPKAELIGNQYLVLFVDQQGVNADIENGHIFDSINKSTQCSNMME